MSDDDRLAEQILDLVVYAPIGLALEARSLIPKLADRGRGQVALARLAGKVASDRGQSEARKVVDQVLEVVNAVLTGDGAASAETDEPKQPVADNDAALPIDGYDTLTAPQLLPYLPPLSGNALDEVLAYEQSHRSRATVINRIRQLQA